MNGLLRQFQSSFKYGGNPIVKRIDSSCLPSNSPCEDETICTLLPSGVNGSHSSHSHIGDSTQLLLAVLDGHYTRHSARFLKDAIPSLLSRISLKSKKILQAQDLKNAFEHIDAHLLDLPWTSHPSLTDSSPLSQYRALSKSERRQIITSSLPAFSGSCALAAYLHSSTLHIANAGDCRAVLGSYDALEKRWKVRTLSEDHTGSNLREQARLSKAHPGETVVFSNSDDGPLRVLGCLMPSRAFGDGRFKWSLARQEKIDMLLNVDGGDGEEWRDLISSNNSFLRPREELKTPPYMTASPELTTVALSRSDKFLVLATDGLFDLLTSSDVVRLLANYKTLGRKGDNAATYLIRQAITMGQDDAFLSRMLSLQGSRLSRSFRDDISCIVVFLNDPVDDADLPQI